MIIKKERYSAKAIHKEDYDIIYGNYRDYVMNRTSDFMDSFMPLVN